PWPALALRRHRRLDDGAAGGGRGRALPEAVLLHPEEGDVRAATPSPSSGQARAPRQGRRASLDAAGGPPPRVSGRQRWSPEADTPAYDADFCEWPQQTAALLRAGRVGEVDGEHLAEEVVPRPLPV